VKVAVAWALETTCTLWEMDDGWIGNMGICNLQKFRVFRYQGIRVGAGSMQWVNPH